MFYYSLNSYGPSGIKANRFLGTRTIRNLQPCAADTVTVDTRIILGYPIAYNLIIKRQHLAEIDKWLVLNYTYGSLHKFYYDSLQHATAVHGEHILVEGTSYRRIRILLINHKGAIIDVCNTLCTRVYN